MLEQISLNVHYLDVNIKVENECLLLDIYYKPTIAFSYLKYNSCHPKHTRNNLARSLAKRIVQIVSENREARLDDLKNHLHKIGHPIEIIEEAFLKTMTPSKKPNEGEAITFNRTFNPSHIIDLRIFRNSINDLYCPKMLKAFQKKWVLCTTRQPQNLRDVLTKANFVLTPTPNEPKRIGLFPCGKCSLCRVGYVKYAREFTFKTGNGKMITWTYNRYFSCNSINVLYIVICVNCRDQFYLGKTIDGKQRCRKHASDVRHPENSNCRHCAEHIRTCSVTLVEPYFSFFPFFYVDNAELRHFMERRFINRWHPPLNGQ